MKEWLHAEHCRSAGNFHKPRCDPRFIQIRTIKAIKGKEVLGEGGNLLPNRLAITVYQIDTKRLKS